MRANKSHVTKLQMLVMLPSRGRVWLVHIDVNFSQTISILEILLPLLFFFFHSMIHEDPKPGHFPLLPLSSAW